MTQLAHNTARPSELDWTRAAYQEHGMAQLPFEAWLLKEKSGWPICARPSPMSWGSLAVNTIYLREPSTPLEMEVGTHCRGAAVHQTRGSSPVFRRGNHDPLVERQNMSKISLGRRLAAVHKLAHGERADGCSCGARGGANIFPHAVCHGGEASIAKGAEGHSSSQSSQKSHAFARGWGGRLGGSSVALGISCSGPDVRHNGRSLSTTGRGTSSGGSKTLATCRRTDQHAATLGATPGATRGALSYQDRGIRRNHLRRPPGFLGPNVGHFDTQACSSVPPFPRPARLVSQKLGIAVRDNASATCCPIPIETCRSQCRYAGRPSRHQHNTGKRNMAQSQELASLRHSGPSAALPTPLWSNNTTFTNAAHTHFNTADQGELWCLLPPGWAAPVQSTLLANDIASKRMSRCCGTLHRAALP